MLAQCFHSQGVPAWLYRGYSKLPVHTGHSALVSKDRRVPEPVSAPASGVAAIGNGIVLSDFRWGHYDVHFDPWRTVTGV